MAGDTVDLDAPVHLIHQPSRDHQPDAGTFDRGPLGAEPVERFKEVRDLSRRQPATRVGHRDPHFGVARNAAHVDAPPAMVVLDRVGQ